MALHFMRDYAHQRLLQRCVGMGVEKPRGNARRRRRQGRESGRQPDDAAKRVMDDGRVTARG